MPQDNTENQGNGDPGEKGEGETAQEGQDGGETGEGNTSDAGEDEYVHDVYIYKDVLDAIEERCKNNKYEIIGNLVGKAYQYKGKKYVIIDGYVFSDLIESTPIFTQVIEGAIGEMAKQKDEKYPSHIIAGWWHSHPNLGVFLSSVDIDTMMMYSEDYHCALVVDPVRDTRGFFKIDDRRTYHHVSYAVLREPKD